MQTDTTIPFELIIITAPQFIPGEVMLLQQLLQAGAVTIHIRKPGSSALQVAAFIQQLPERYHQHLVVHQHHDLLKQFRLKGVHGVTQATALGTRSLSLHHWHELESVPPATDYIFVSPVFDSLSKAGYAANPLLLQRPAIQYSFRVIALGGITPDNVQQLVTAGWDGAAVLGWIWNEPARAVEQYRLLQQAIRSLSHAS